MNAQELIETLPAGTQFLIQQSPNHRYVVEDNAVREIRRADESISRSYPHSGQTFQFYADTDIVDIVRPAEPIVEVPTPEVEIERLRARVRELESAEISVYDDRMRPFAIRAARIATNAGFCSEYDRIASATGMPSRDDLFRREYRHCVSVTLTLHVDMTDDEYPDWSNDEIIDALNSEHGLRLSSDDLNISWEITDSEEGDLIDSETGERVE